MIVLSNPLVLVLLVPLFALTIAIWHNGYANLSQRRRQVALAARLLLITLVVLSLADLHIRWPQSRQATVFVADLSDSVAATKSAMQATINAAAQQRSDSNLAGVVITGREAKVEQPVSALPGFDAFGESVDANYTNLEGGLELAGAIMPDGYRRRVVLLSDGQQNVGDALTSARLLRSEGVRLDVMPANVPGGPEVLVDRVEVPAQLRLQERFSLSVAIRSTVNTGGTLDVYRDNAVIISRHETIRSGENRYTFDQPALHPGFHTYRVHITPSVDTQPSNNVGSAFRTVQGPPRVLIIADDPRKAANVVASLRTTGIAFSLQRPDTVVPTLGYLQRYAAVVIVDTAADIIGPDLTAQLVPYVRDLGHGLLVIGGQESYGMGGYGGTPLEAALPVKMDLPKRNDLPSAAVVLVIESLEAETQINISKEAGKGILQLLTPQDQIAVNDTPFDNSSGWTVPLQHVRNKSAISHAIDSMQPGDPGSYATYLEAAYQALKHASARVKHIIVLGDGDAEDPDYAALARKIRAGGVTISTVATNGLGYADFQVMHDIAQWGGGRYYRADDTSSIPKIFLREARTVARSGVIEGKFFPQELSANPMVRDLRGVPPLFGYVATVPKPAGELVLVSKKLDPVLAGWQFGLGRAVAWTSDASGLWTHDWLQAPGANRFWANLVSWTMPASQAGHLFISTGSAEGQGQISVNTPPSLGANPNVTARVIGPDLHAVTVQLQPESPGKYRGTFGSKAQGSYFVTVEARGAGHGDAGQVGLDVPYSAEYRVSGTNLPFLRALAAAGGGSVIRTPDSVWLDNLPSVYDQRSLAGMLLLVALLLLPVDIAIRRLIVGRRDWAVFRAALPFGHPAMSRSTPVVTSLDTVRAKRSKGRARQTGAVPLSVPAQAGTTAPEGTQTVSPKRAARPIPAESKSALATDQSAAEESTAGRLLAAKKRRH